jgi:ribosomal protein S18 acetylase RimI-like enzyme
MADLALTRVRLAAIDDHLPLVRSLDDWWGRPTRHRLPRLWFEHFTGTSLVAEDEAGRRIGFVVGFVSPDRPEEAYVHLLGVAPGRRRRGVGRTLWEAFAERARERGARRVSTIVWPADPIGVAFLRGIGFVVDDGPGTRPLYGVPARTDWNDDRDDQALFGRDL